MKKIFAPGCALMLYKPELAIKLHELLQNNFGSMKMLHTCCRHNPKFNSEIQIINICPGCDKRFRNNYDKCNTISLWEILANANFFSFPDYQGQTMSILDACPIRMQPQIHDAIRVLLTRMKLNLIEPEKTRSNSTCCGDSLYGVVSIEKVKNKMTSRAKEILCDDVVVYCVSCIKAMFIGGKHPRYLIDLLFNEDTIPKTFEPEKWHKELDQYIEKH